MAAAVLWSTFSVTLVRTALVVDGVREDNGRQGVVLRVAKWLRTRESHKLPSRGQNAQLARSGDGDGGGGSGSRRAPRSKNSDMQLRLLRGRLLMMHAMATLAQSASVAKYTVPASATSCLITQRLMVALFVLYDATLVLFILAKTYAITSSRTTPSTPSCWVRIVTWWSLFWGWIYLPVLAVVIGSTYPGGMNAEGNGCSGGIEDTSDAARKQFTARFLLAKGMLMIELVLLLAVFAKPLLINQAVNLSSVAASRQAIVRSIAVTAAMLVAYMIGTLTVFFIAANSSSVSKATQFADVSQAVQSFLTLCLTEVIVPLGFTSCFKSCRVDAGKFRGVERNMPGVVSVVSSTASAGKSLAHLKAVSPTSSLP